MNDSNSAQKVEVKDLSEHFGEEVIADPIECNVGSLHVYERHFRFLTE